MKISIHQINPIIGDFEYNISQITAAVKESEKSGCSLAVFPELSLMGYPPKDLLEKPAFISRNLEYLEKLSGKTGDMSVLCGFVDRNPSSQGKGLLNSIALLNNGGIVDKGGKKLLPSYDVFDETRYFEPAENSLLFTLEGLKIGVTICEDIWNVGDIEDVPQYDNDPVDELCGKGIDLLINISASPYTINKPQLRLRVLEKIARKYNIPVLYCNQAGGNDDLVFDGSSMVVNKKGELILLGAEFQQDNIEWDTEKTYERS